VSIGPLIHPKYPDVDDTCKATDNFLGFMIMQVYHVSPLTFGEKYAGSKQTNEGPYIKQSLGGVSWNSLLPRDLTDLPSKFRFPDK
jgi:hypothetical protein